MEVTLRDLRNNIDGIYSITTNRVADILGISREHYSRLERGFYKLDTLKIEKLATLFKVKPAEIVKAWENSRGGEKHERNSRNWKTTFKRIRKIKIKKVSILRLN